MHVRVRNINQAFRELVYVFHRESSDSPPGEVPVVRTGSRNGGVLRVAEPVTVTYERPDERVLFNLARDCNPWFHLYESLWMLAGRNDLDPLLYYNKRMADFSDNGETLNGAYGCRWRHARYPQIDAYAEVDQLDALVRHLKDVPESRRAALQMWNVGDDLLKIGGPCDCGADRTGPSAEAHDPDCAVRASKDVCCNLAAVFELREDMDPVNFPRAPEMDEFLGERAYKTVPTKKLDVTVFNRSNDLTWGMLGANAVQFSMLLEYMAARLGVGVGEYHQVTSNLHAYLDRWRPEEWLADTAPDMYAGRVSCPSCKGVGKTKDDEAGPQSGRFYGRLFKDEWECTVCHGGGHWPARTRDDYRAVRARPSSCASVPLVSDPERFERELPEFVEWHSRDSMATQYGEPFLQYVAQPMCVAWHHHKRGDLGRALAVARSVASDDWRAAAVSWMGRRKAAREGKFNAGVE